MSQKNIAVIGAGYWGKNLVRNFYQLVTLKTICDGAQAIRDEMSKAYPELLVTDKLDAVVNDPNIQGKTFA